ncbi:unnamed protein product [Cladocopium goreaui]|uniref:Uncharacterized protein n=1 Tax=Cladocopium goreaui TaxID=2562237 RepID=A0A9P1CP08_9DINO|nr:unnamed protein product [Cladocopium goreaui]
MCMRRWPSRPSHSVIARWRRSLTMTPSCSCAWLRSRLTSSMPWCEPMSFAS